MNDTCIDYSRCAMRGITPTVIIVLNEQANNESSKYINRSRFSVSELFYSSNVINIYVTDIRFSVFYTAITNRQLTGLVNKTLQSPFRSTAS